MSGADDANGASVLVAPDWEGAVDGAIRTHERIYRRMEALADERFNRDGLDSIRAVMGVSLICDGWPKIKSRTSECG